MISGHFGNFEVGGYLNGLFGFRTYTIARPLDNPFL
jgi:KDO2-lipid IV(A) lauroyltransferase